MYKPKRQANVFSLSALDLFASAMGAFVIVCIVLFPDYLKTQQVLAQSAALESQIAETREQIDRYREEIEHAKTTVTLEDVRKQRQASEEELKIVLEEVGKIEDEIKRSVKFTLFGLQTDADDLTLVVDLSGSMTEYRELLIDLCGQIIGSLTDEHTLSIVGFRITGDEPEIIVWPRSVGQLTMSLPNKAASLEQVEELADRFAGGTPTYDALLRALDLPSQTIVLVTDGIPSYPVGMSAPDIVELVTVANGDRKQIHTVGIGEFNSSPVFIDFIQSLAQRNGGDFTSYAR